MKKRPRPKSRPRPSARPARRPSPGAKKSPAPRRPGDPRARDSSPTFPWQWVGVGVGAIALLLALFFGVRALFGGQATPVPRPTITSGPTSTPTVTATAAVTLTATLAPTTEAAGIAPDIPALQQLMLQLVNDDRRANGFSEVGLDSTATNVGVQHAHEMAQFSYISHWNLEGYGPDHRYSMAGGSNHVMENVYYFEHTPGYGPKSVKEWEERIREAQESLMESPGHRANILTPGHTHLGVGIAYEKSNGRLAIAQEFVDQYVSLTSPAAGARSVSLGGSVTVAGKLNAGASNPLLVLVHEPFPVEMSVAELNETSTYIPAESYDVLPLDVDSDGRFDTLVPLNHNDQPGLYHIKIQVDTEFGPVTAVDVVIRVQ